MPKHKPLPSTATGRRRLLKLKETGFVAVNVETKPPHIMVWSMAARAYGVRSKCVQAWPDRNGRHATWNDVKRDGVRVCKVKIETL